MSETLEKDKKLGQEEDGDEEEEEYVLLELGDCLYSDIPPGAPFVLSGLDTLTPTLIVGNGLKLVGEYEETVGTCYLFSESEAQPKTLSNETPPSEENTDDPTSRSNKEAPSKEGTEIRARLLKQVRLKAVCTFEALQCHPVLLVES